MKLSTNLSKEINKKQIDINKILYLNIAKPMLKEILSKEKKVEFREFTDFYINKIIKLKNGKFHKAIPKTHILFQNGYTAESPRALVEIDKICIHRPEDPDDKSEKEDIAEYIGEARIVTEIKKTDRYGRILQEAKREGFTKDDFYIAFELKEIVFTERC